MTRLFVLPRRLRRVFPAIGAKIALHNDNRLLAPNGNDEVIHGAIEAVIARRLITDDLDPFYQRMVAAALGDGPTWRLLTRSLRDAMVDYAIRYCPYYRENIDPTAPFEQIPLLTKAAIRQNQAALLSSIVPAERRSQHATSGSTGEPMVFYRDLSSFPADVAARHFLRRLHQVPVGEPTVWVVAPGNGGVARPDDPTAHLVLTTDLTPEFIAHEIETWSRFQSYSVYGYTSAIESIVDVIERTNLSVSTPPACVITTGDFLTLLAKQRIERVLNAPVHSWYGSNEMNGFLAGTLPNTQRYVLNPLIAYVEITDDDGQPLPAGAIGHLVLTHLSNYAFPFIRYDTGDRAAIAPDQNAGGFVVLEQLEGRSSERVRFPSGKTLSAITLGNRIVVAPGFAPYIRHFQCALIADNALELRVVWNETPPTKVIVEMEDSLRMHTDPDTVIHVKSVESIGTLPSGKRWIVRDERGI